MEQGHATQLTPAELVNRVRQAYGMTWDELGAAMGRSGRMMRKIARGETSGESYRAALDELHRSGAVEHRPPRRRGKDGGLVKVRAKKGSEAKSVAPAEEAEQEESTPRRRRAVASPAAQVPEGQAYGHEGQTPPVARSPRRTFNSETTYLAGGNRIHKIDMPKSQGAKGREQGIAELRRRVTNVARGSSRQDKRVRLQATVDIGGGRTRTVDVGSKGGYLAGDIVSDVRDRSKGDMTSWMRGQIGDRYVEEMDGKARIVSVTMTTFNADRPKAQRVAQDEAGVRRWNRRWTGSRWT